MSLEKIALAITLKSIGIGIFLLISFHPGFCQDMESFQKLMKESRSLQEQGDYDSALYLLGNSNFHDNIQLEPKDYITILLLESDLLRDNGHFDSALKRYYDAISYVNKEFVANDSLRAWVNYGMGLSYREIAENDSSFILSERAVNLMSNSPGKDSLAFAITVRGLSDVYMTANRIDEGLALLDSSINIMRRNSYAISREMVEALAIKSFAYFSLSREKEEYQYAKEAFEIARQVYPREHYVYFDCLIDVCKGARKVIDFEKHSEYLEEALELTEITSKNRSDALIDVYGIQADLARDKGDFETVLELRKKSLELQREKSEDEGLMLGVTMFNLAGAFDYNDDPFQARSYLQKAYNIFESLLDEENYFLAYCKQRIGFSYYREKNYPLALEYLNEAYTRFLSIFGESHNLTYKTAQLLGLVYIDMGDLEKAREYYEFFFEQRKANAVSPNSPDLGRTYTVMAELYGEEGDLSRSEEALLKAISLIEQAENPELYTDDLTITLEELGDVKFDQKRYKEAEEVYHKALENSDPVFKNIGPDSLPDLISLRGKIASIVLLDRKAQSILARANEDESLILKALETFKLASKLSLELRSRFYEVENRKVLIRKSLRLYQGGVKAAYRMYKATKKTEYLEELFYFIELGKALSLYDILRENNRLKFAQIPEEVVAEEHRLRVDIGFYQKMIWQGDFEGDSSALEEFRLKLFDLREDYAELKESLRKEYPEYYGLNYDFSIPEITSLQRELPNSNHALVEYFWSESDLYTMILTKEKVQVFETPLENTLLGELEEYLPQWREGEFIQSDMADGNSMDWPDVLHQLHRELLGKADLKGIDHLVIIPDGVLGYLPFDMLLTENVPEDVGVNYSLWPFMLRKYTIQYNYSANLWRSLKSRTVKSGGDNFLGVAPQYNTQSLATNRGINDFYAGKLASLSELQGNQKEVENIATILTGDVLLAENATEAEFKINASKRQILHLAMHTILDDDKPMLSAMVFSQSGDTIEDDLLHAYEIYGMQLPAEMAVLSACETGIGKIIKGEGIMSLARAFHYAGCKNIVMTTWQAEDYASQQLMERFYQHLGEGLGKADALRQAKLDMLSETDRSNPFFWAPFVLIGDNEPLQIGLGVWIYVISAIGAIAVLIMAIAIVSRRKKRRAGAA